MVWLFLLASLEIHGLLGGSGVQIPALDLQRDLRQVDLFAGVHHLWVPSPSLTLRVGGTFRLVGVQGSMFGMSEFGGLVPVASWFSALDTLARWHATEPDRSLTALLAVAALSLTLQLGGPSLEVGRFPVPLGLNPWLSVLDPLRPVPRWGPFLAFSGVDGLQAAWRCPRAEVRAFWIPARRDTRRSGGWVHLYFPSVDLLFQYLHTRNEEQWGMGLQGNLLEGVFRLEAAYYYRESPVLPQTVGSRWTPAYEVSYTRAWGSWTLDLLLITSSREVFQWMDQGNDRLMAFLSTERERWGGQIGLDRSLNRAAGALWLEAHYWWTPSVRLFAWGSLGQWTFPWKGRFSTVFVGASLYH